MVNPIFKEWVSVTSWHGVDDFHKATSTVSKLVWLLIITASTVMILIQTFMQMNTYFNNLDDPWISVPSFERGYKIKLPIISICSMNKVSKQSLKRLSMDLDAAAFLVEIQNYAVSAGLSNDLPFGPAIVSKQLEAFQNYSFNFPKRENWTIYDFALNLAPDCESILLQFRTKLGALKVQGSKLCSNSRKYFSMDQVCYSFDKLLNWPPLTMAGDSSGVIVLLNNSKADYAPVTQAGTATNGITIFVDPDEMLGPGLSIGVVIPPAQNLKVAMYVERGTAPDSYSVFPQPDWPCHLNSSLQIWKADFTEDRCLMDCFMLLHVYQCGCNPFAVPIRKGYNYCSPEEAYTCFARISKQPLNADTATPADIPAMCSNKCNKPACIYENIHNTATGLVPLVNLTKTVETMNALQNTSYTNEQFMHVSQVEIFYETLKVKVVNYKLKASLSNLISNIGGQMGIWAGMSLITIIQALFYAVFGLFQVTNAFMVKQKVAKSDHTLRPETFKNGNIEMHGKFYESQILAYRLQSNISVNKCIDGAAICGR